MSGRLILAIFSTILEEAALAVIVLLGLPRLGIDIPLPGLIALMAAWCAFSVITYRMGSRALRRKPVVSLLPMVGSKGKVVSPLAPDGFIKIKGELWVAKSTDKDIDVGEEVTVLRQDGLTVIVHKSSTSDLEKT